jgi:hypothetical protein
MLLVDTHDPKPVLSVLKGERGFGIAIAFLVLNEPIAIPPTIGVGKVLSKILDINKPVLNIGNLVNIIRPKNLVMGRVNALKLHTNLSVLEGKRGGAALLVASHLILL